MLVNEDNHSVEDTENISDCSACGSKLIIYDPDTGEGACGECGMVMEDVTLDHGPEWTSHTLAEKMDKSRAGAPLSNTYYDRGLTTSFNPKDVRGLGPEERKRMWRLKKWDSRAKLDENKMRNLNIALTELDRVVGSLHVPNNVKEHAADIYRKSLDKDLIRGRSISDFVAASVYAACRNNKVPRSLQEVSEVSTRDIKSISRTYRLLLKELDIRMPIDYPMKFLPQIASKVGVTRETERLAYDILRRAQGERVLTGKDPRGMAAAALYMACKATGDKGTQNSVAEAAGTSEVTLRNRLRDLEELFGKQDESRFDHGQVLDMLTPQVMH
jgi:transcription initiation factor TFIIB